MDCSTSLTGGRMTFVTLWWFISARKWFKGPVINIEVLTLHAHTSMINTNSGSIICLAAKKQSSRVWREARTAMFPVSTRRSRQEQELPSYLIRRPRKSSRLLRIWCSLLYIVRKIVSFSNDERCLVCKI